MTMEVGYAIRQLEERIERLEDTLAVLLAEPEENEENHPSEGTAE